MSKSIRKEEFIVCAAVRTKEHGTTIRMFLEYPLHIKNDIQRYGVFGEFSHERGFITNKNRFVDPKEALEITEWKNKLYFKDKDYLTPEDLLYYQSLIINRGSVL